MRTHTCGGLQKKEVGNEVTLCGWVDAVRSYGKIAFIDIRDRYGMTQVFLNKSLASKYGTLRRESVIKVKGKVNARPENQINKEMATGEIELEALEMEILNAVPPLPIELDETVESNEDTRLKYRFLDLRKPRMQKNIILRHKVAFAIREFLNKRKFIEIETPILGKSTPEGARDYLVPSRVNPKKFYALPQSPQLFKQLLMVAGYDRYFQIVKCFRDEDLRADRQPEFTQLDMEWSFPTEDTIFTEMETLMQYVWKTVLNMELKVPFQRMTYAEAMEKYSSDKPDLRKEGDQFKFLWVTDFPLFEEDEEGRVKAMHHPFTAPNEEDVPLLETDKLKVRSRGYDLVLNGVELGGGSIRIHQRDVQEQMFKALGIEKDEAEEKFGFLLKALQFAPPHGGIAFGLDRWAMLMAGEESIREVIAFPKNKDARDIMLDAPSAVDTTQLDEVGVKVKE